MSEKEYIERKVAIDRLFEAIPYHFALQTGLERAINYLQSIPAADVRPVVRGRWIDHQEGRWIYAKCSECGTVHDVKSNFCPNCGADMREES